MYFSLTIKVIGFIISILIFEKSQGAPINNNYMLLRPDEMRRLSRILQSAAGIRIDPKTRNKREDYDETTMSRPIVGRYNGTQEIYTLNNGVKLTNIGKLPANEYDNEIVQKDVQRKLENWFHTSINDIPV